jgi:hypothetical protein
MLTIRRAAAAVGAGLLLSLCAALPANADDSGCAVTGTCGGGATPEVSGHTVVVRVSGSLVSGGSPGSGGGTTSVSVPSPCWYIQGMSGKEYAEWVDSGKAQYLWYHTNAGNGAYQPVAGYEQHKNDDKGHYYGGECSSETFGDDIDGFFSYADKWFADHPEVWVDAGNQPPVPPIPPQVLRDAALKAMTLPEPTFSWSPQMRGDNGTLVNLQTWFWQNQPVLHGDVTASAGGNSATVTADVTSVVYDAPTADHPASCPDGGTPYSRGASSSCTLEFVKATPAGGSETVTATASWGLSWSYNGAGRGALDPVSITDQAPLVVKENQALVTSVH